MDSQRDQPGARGGEHRVDGSSTTQPSVTNTDRTRKAVSIVESNNGSPLLLGKSKDADESGTERTSRHHSARLGKRLSGRLSSSQPNTAPVSPFLNAISQPADATNGDTHTSHHGMSYLIDEVATWLHAEKERVRARKALKKGKSKRHGLAKVFGYAHEPEPERERSDSGEDSDSGTEALRRLERILKQSTSQTSLDKFHGRKSSSFSRRPVSLRKLRQSTASSDTEYEVDQAVPSCEVVLDNSKTLAYLGNPSASNLELTSSNRVVTRDKQAWYTFKYEILRLTHTLQFRGWRHIPLERSTEIDVERLSGALTNAVYVVSPPPDMPTRSVEGDDGLHIPMPRKLPPKLLLRIYGPQVEHLIDRAAELQILRRLGRKRIGPRMLGTFTNGRFEQYFHARTLRPQDLRHPETSRQIAKRMRELHDGIELEEQERMAGPFVWCNWDKWVDRCEKVMAYTDRQVLSRNQDHSCYSSSDLTGSRFVCGTDWKTFRKVVERYRQWLNDQYGGADKLREHLIFAHNDTQYGNILRLEPPGESPLLLPANEHKQLIVIDFEYANANMPGLEFANHFTEWCYNYHDPIQAHACNTSQYPSLEEQRRFIQAYVLHRPQYAPAASSTPRMLPQERLVETPSPAASPRPRTTPASTHRDSFISSIFTHNLRAPSQHHQSSRESTEQSYFNLSEPPTMETLVLTPAALGNTPNAPLSRGEGDAAAANGEIAGLLRETRLWRLANSAQWVVWGVVQAKVPGFQPEENYSDENGVVQADKEEVDPTSGTDPLSEESRANMSDLADRRPSGEHERTDVAHFRQEEDEEAVTEEEFDYLSYARDRAMFFWGDCLQMGFVSEEELEQWGLLKEVKVVPW